MNVVRMKVLYYRECGVEISASPDKILEYSIEDEKASRDVGPFDPAFEYFARRSRLYLEAACLKESHPEYFV